MAMDTACIRTAAGHRKRAIERRLAGILRIGPGGIAAEGADRRPLRHRRRRSAFVEGGKCACAIDYLSANNGEVGGRVGDLILEAREIVPVRHDQIGKLTNLNSPLLSLLVREPCD